MMSGSTPYFVPDYWDVEEILLEEEVLPGQTAQDLVGCGHVENITDRFAEDSLKVFLTFWTFLIAPCFAFNRNIKIIVLQSFAFMFGNNKMFYRQTPKWNCHSIFSRICITAI